jgi:hypothetical protein
MLPAERDPKVWDQLQNLRVANAALPQVALEIWRCAECGIERPRFP